MGTTMKTNVTNGSAHMDYSFVMNATYYSIFLPVTFIGNALSLAVVAVIVYHKRTRRSIADLLLGALALVDLFSLFTVHAVSLAYIARKDQNMSDNLSIFQGFSASVYMKLQFLIQICISMDRYLALVRPLQYNARFTSRRVMFLITSVLVIVAASSSTLLATTCPPNIHVVQTWPISLLTWSFLCVPHAVVACLTSIVFAIGIVAFVCCNLNLVRILWKYRSQKEKINEFSHVVNVLEKKVSQHLQASQTTLHKLKVNPRLNDSRSNSLRTPEVYVTASAGQKEDDKRSTNNCNGNLYTKQNSLEPKPLFTTQTSTNSSNSENCQTAKQSQSNGSSVYHTASEDIDLENVSKTKVFRTKNIHNLTLVVNVEEPTSSPEAGTPDSQCNLIDKLQVDQKFCIDHERKLTPETPEIRIEGPCDEEENTKTENGKDPGKDDLFCHGNVDESFVITAYGLIPSRQTSNDECDGKDYLRQDSSPRPMTPNTLEIFSPRTKKSVSFSSVILDACTKEVVLEPRSPLPTKDDVTLMTHLTDYIQKVLKSWGKKTEKQRREVLLARLVAVCSSVYLATWIPYTVTVLLSMAGKPLSPIVTDVSLRLIFANAALNPIFYGLCRSNYRKGYHYISLMVLHYICCGLVSKPGDDKTFFESKTKKVKRHLAAAEMNMHMRVRRQRRRAMSAQALQILQQLRQAMSPGDNNMSYIPENQDGFQPSSQLQDLFQQCMELQMSDSESSSFDYDHLLFTDSFQDDFLQNLKQIWSLYESEPLTTNNDEEDFDFEFNYDEMVSSDHRLDEVFYGLDTKSFNRTTSVIEGVPNNSNKTRKSSL